MPSKTPVPAKTILVVEDDPAIRRAMVDALRRTGFEVRQAADGIEALRQAEGAELVLLDLLLPGRDGLAVLGELRQRDPGLPIILVTALGGEAQRVEGLRLGADDYVVKPFSVPELLARVEAVLRRSPERPRPLRKLRLAHGEIDLERHEVHLDNGQRTQLSALETDLLRYLAGCRDRTVSREELLHRVWHAAGHRIATRSVDMTVARLRRKVADAGSPDWLMTVRGEGYKLNL